MSYFSIHLKQWLHGPEAEGRCPNCENACSLAGGTLSLDLAKAIHSSFSSTPVHPHSKDTLTSLRDKSHPRVASAKSSGSTCSCSCSCSSSVDYSETGVSAEESKPTDEHYHIHHPFPSEEHLTDSFSLPWGVVSRLISILVFLMFLYKLRS